MANKKTPEWSALALNNFGLALKRLRKSRAWRQQDLANHLNVRQQAVQKWERESRLPVRSKHLPALCGLLGIPVPAPTKGEGRVARRDVTDDRAVLDALDMAGLSDLQKACLKRARALMREGVLGDQACLELLVGWGAETKGHADCGASRD